MQKTRPDRSHPGSTINVSCVPSTRPCHTLPASLGPESHFSLAFLRSAVAVSTVGKHLAAIGRFAADGLRASEGADGCRVPSRRRRGELQHFSTRCPTCAKQRPRQLADIVPDGPRTQEHVRTLSTRSCYGCAAATRVARRRPAKGFQFHASQGYGGCGGTPRATAAGWAEAPPRGGAKSLWSRGRIPQ